MGVGFLAMVPTHASQDRGVLSVPSIRALPAGVDNIDKRRWTLNHRASSCPAGRRNADAQECLHAIEEAVVGTYIIARFNVLTNVDGEKEDGWSSGIPTGCSYSNLTQRAIFKHSQSSSSFQNVKENYRHVCTNDDRATDDTDGPDTAPWTISLSPSPSPSPLPSPSSSPLLLPSEVRESVLGRDLVRRALAGL